MAKVKLTKGELKRQRDDLKRFQRYLPMLELKQQQLQLEVLRMRQELEKQNEAKDNLQKHVLKWAKIFADDSFDIRPWIRPEEVHTETKNIAGVDIPVLERVLFKSEKYNLYLTPFWIDAGIRFLQEFVHINEEIKILKEALQRLERELLVTSQRVNLFADVMIPRCNENIRTVRIYLGDQQAAAVGRSKIAKRKIAMLEKADAAA